MLPSRERSGLFLMAILDYMFEDKEPIWRQDEQEFQCWKLVLPGLNSSKKQSRNGKQTKGIERPNMKGNQNARKKKTARPTLEEVKDYAHEIGYDAKADKFFYHYDGHTWPENWKSTMKSWMIDDDDNGMGRRNRLHVSAKTPDDYEGEF